MKNLLIILCFLGMCKITSAQTYLPLTGGTLTGNVEIHSSTPLLQIHSPDNSVFRGIEFIHSSALDAHIKQQAVSGELQISVGRNASWGGFQTFYTDLVERMRITPTGNIGIGTSKPSEKLSVNGKIRAHEVKVETTGWPDYVFEPSYKLLSLKKTEQYIQDNGHLPEIPSAKEVKENGIALGEMNAKLLQKIEELTLYIIDLKKDVDELKAREK